MGNTTFRGEKNLGELVSRIFPGLTSSELKAAQKALLRANPQLSSFDKLQTGALLVVPNISAHQSKTRSEPDVTAATFVRTIEEALHQYKEHLISVSEQVTKEEQETIKRLKQSNLKKIFENDNDLLAAADNVMQAAKERANNAEKLRTFATQELTASQNDLTKLLDRLR